MKIFLILLLALSAQAQSTLYDDFSQGNRTLTGGDLMYQILDIGLTQNFPFQTLTFGSNKMTVTVAPINNTPVAITNVINSTDAYPGIMVIAPGHKVYQNDCVKVQGVTGITQANVYTIAKFNPGYSIVVTATNASPIAIGTQNPHELTSGWAVQNLYMQGNTAANGFHYAKVIDATHIELYDDAALTVPVAGNGALTNPYFGHVSQSQYLVLDRTTWPGGTYTGGGTVTRTGCGADTVTTYGSGGWPLHFMAGYPISGTWDDNVYNRFRFYWKCDTSFIPDPQGDATFSFGTYVRAKNDVGPGGAHYYMNLNPYSYANKRAVIELNRNPSGNRDWGADPVMDDPMWNMGFTIGSTPVHYWDGMADHYWFIGGTAIMEQYSAFSCQYSQMTMDTFTGGSDSYVHNLLATYTGSGTYRLHWSGARYVPGGVVHEIRYSSAGSCKSLGFSNCTSGGTVTSASNTPITWTNWESGALSEAANMYLAIRPRMPVYSASITGSQPLILTTYSMGHDLTTGDSVAASGLSGAGVTDGTYTITNIPPVKFATTGSAARLTNVVVSSGVATGTTTLAHGLKTGQVIWVCGNIPAPPDDVCFPGYDGHQYNAVLTGIPSSTTFTWATSAPNATWANTYVVSWPALSLDGTSASGTYTSGGLIIPNDNDRNFAEVLLPAEVNADYTFTGPSGGAIGSPSTNFTVTPNSPYTGTITLTPSGGGLSTPVVKTFSSSAAPQTFTITPSSVGPVTLTPTNNDALIDPSALVYATPSGAPTIGTATAGNASLSLTFTAPVSTGGSAITGYTATCSPGGSGTGASSPIAVSSLSNGTPYTCTVTATNAIGTSAASGASGAVTPTATGGVGGTAVIGGTVTKQ